VADSHSNKSVGRQIGKSAGRGKLVAAESWSWLQMVVAANLVVADSHSNKSASANRQVAANSRNIAAVFIRYSPFATRCRFLSRLQVSRG
jgi:hypothetical protein